MVKYYITQCDGSVKKIVAASQLEAVIQAYKVVMEDFDDSVEDGTADATLWIDDVENNKRVSILIEACVEPCDESIDEDEVEELEFSNTDPGREDFHSDG